MSDKVKTSIRIQRPARVNSDGRARSVWSETVETAEFELLSTVALKKILKSSDEAAKESIAAAASTGNHGVLARDMATGRFKILDDAEFQKSLRRIRSRPVMKRLPK